MVAIATAFIKLAPDVDRAAFIAAGKRMGDQAGDAAGKSMGARIMTQAQAGLRATERQGRASGERLGTAVASGLGQKLNRQLRDLNLPELNLKTDATSANLSITATQEHLRSLAANADNIQLRLDASNALRDINRLGKQVGVMSTETQRSGQRLKSATDNTSAFGSALALTAARATLFGATAAAALPSVINLTAALAPAAGAAVALPAALLAGRAALGVFKIATADVGDALKQGFTGSAEQAKKALDKLPPAARTFAQAIIALRPQVEALRASVSQRFFQPLQDDIRPLAQLYFPMLRDRMAELAGPLGGLGEQIAQSARRAGTFRAVASIFDAARESVINLRGAVDPLVGAFSALIHSTAPFLPGLAQGFTNLAVRVGAFVTQAAQSGQIAQAFRNAMTVIRDLGGILVNVGSILGSVFTAASRGSGTLLGNLRALTGQVAAFLRSAQGSGALTSVFSTLATLGAALRTSLAAVLPAVARSLGIIGPVIAGLAAPAAQLITALAPLLPYFTSLAAIVLRAVTPAIAALAGWLAQNGTVLKIVASALAAGIGAFRVIAIVTRAWAAAQTALNVILAANPIGIVVVALAALVAGLVVAYRNSETFRAFVDKLGRSIVVAWGQMRTVIGAVSSWFTGTIMPSINTAISQGAATWRFLSAVVRAVWAGISLNISTFWNVIRAILIANRSWLTIVGTAFRTFGQIGALAVRTLGSGIAAVWNSIRTGSFAPLRDFISRTLPGAFRTGVAAIRAAWDTVREAARRPVDFVVHSVINPLIRGYNRIAGVFHAPTANEIIFGTGGGNNAAPRAFSGFARGGRIPGPASLRDNQLAMAPNGPLAVASGEYIVNSRSTAANLPLIDAINKARGRVNIGDIDPYLDGAARGGMIGDGIGDFLGRVWSGFQGIGSFIADPVKGLKRVAGAAMNRIPGAGPILRVLRGMGGNIVNGIGKLLAGMGGGALGGGNIAGGWRGMRALIAARFPALHMISGFRPGARTLTGNQSYHALGRAVDYPPVRALAAWIRGTYGARTKELITPWQDLNLWNGRPHTYHGAVWNQHNFAGGNAHVHWAAALGGLVSQMSGMPLRLFDQGGAWPSGTLGANLSGRTEYVSRDSDAGITYELHFHGPVASEQGAEDMVVRAITAARRKRRIT